MEAVPPRKADSTSDASTIKLRQVSSNLLVSTPVKVLQLPPPAVSPIRLTYAVEVGNWFLLEMTHASAHRCKRTLCLL